MSTIKRSVSLALLFAASTACAQPFSGEPALAGSPDYVRYVGATHELCGGRILVVQDSYPAAK